MPPLPWSPGSPGEPLEPYTTMVVSTVTADISTCPSHFNMCYTCVRLVLSAGFALKVRHYGTCSGKKHQVNWKSLLGSRLHESHNLNPSLLAPLISDEAHGKRCNVSVLPITDATLFPELTVFPQGCALFHQRCSVLMCMRSISDIALAL